MTERVFRREADLPVSPDEAFRWHLAPGALTRLSPGFEDVRLVEEPAVEAGARGVLAVKKGPLTLRWVARITEVDHAARRFVDEQESGPFRSWRHSHTIEATGDPRRARLVDEVHWQAPLGPLGAAFGSFFIERQLARLFAWRHRTTQHDLALHARYGMSKKRIAITGATGFVGSRLAALLTTGGHEVLRLVRRTPKSADEVQWDPVSGRVDSAALEGLDAVIHLAGESVVGLRWTDAKKERIRASRTQGSAALVAALGKLETPPRAFIAASAIGLYGERGDEVLTEASARGSGFLADTCAAWEAETGKAAAFARVAQLRLGVVLDPAGGALRAMLPAFRMGAGGPLAGGRMWFPWIALDDVLGAFVHALAREDVRGPVNLAAPGEVQQREFARVLGRTLGRPAFAPAPRFAVRALLGNEQADEMLLASVRVRPEALLRTGFEFRWPELGGALAHVLGVARD